MRQVYLGLAVWCALAAEVCAQPKPAPAKKNVPIGPDVVLEIDGDERRVIVQSKVVLRKGLLEGLLTRNKKNKDHEYILACDADARHIHVALLGAGVKIGSTVAFEPKFKAPTGGGVRVSLRYIKGKKTVIEPAGSWVRNVKTQKAFPGNWVFAGSFEGPHPDDETRPANYYMANHGDLITLVNIRTAMVDVPFESPKRPDARLFEADTDRIPEVGTTVELLLEVVPKPKR